MTIDNEIYEKHFKKSFKNHRNSPKLAESMATKKPSNGGVGKTTSLLSAHFRRIFIAIKQKNSGK
jgi:hypothetical protein